MIKQKLKRKKRRIEWLKYTTTEKKTSDNVNGYR